MTSRGLVIVGAGQAGTRVASTLREAGDDRPVTIIGEEPLPPYDRPGLSKGVLQGRDEPASLTLHDTGWYVDNEIRLLSGDPVVALDLTARSVRLASGAEVPYADLVLATGARSRTLDLTGAGLPGVHTLRSLSDCLALRDAFGPGRRLVVIGAGWIGLEVAAAAVQAGMYVTVLEHADVPLRAALGDRMGTYFAELHRGHGVDLHTGVSITAIEGRDAVTGVRVGDTVVPADLVLVGVGAIPNAELAHEAGLQVDNGILVDDQLRARPDVLAVGDVANAENTLLGARLRVEHVDNANRQGRLAAKVLLGHDARYDWLPFFYTDQYDLGMEYVGRGAATDEVVVRGSQDSGQFIAFWQRQGVVTAAMNVNIWDVNDQLRMTVGRRIDPSRLIDEGIDLAEL